MLAVLKKELKTYYTSLFAYLYYFMFFLVMGLLFAFNCLSTYSTQFGYRVLNHTFLVIAIMIPFCTMRLFAQERKNKTDQLLFTAPVSMIDILLGKYLATLIFVLLPVVMSFLYPVYISEQGEMSIRFMMAAYLAVFLVSLLLLSIGMFISSITSNMVIAAVISYVVYAVILLSRIIENVISIAGVKEILHNISVYNKYNDMVSGIVRSGDVLYLLLLTIGFFLLTWISLEGRRKQKQEIIVKNVCVIVFVFIVSAIGLHFTKVWDFTAERLLSFSEETKEIVCSIDKPTEMYYLGDKSRANATYIEFLEEYSRLNENLTVYYKDVYQDEAFWEQYLSRLSKVNEASILVVCGEKYIYLDSEDFITTKWTSKYSSQMILEIEQQVSSAIYYTNSELSEEVSVVTGHGESRLNAEFANTLLVNDYVLKDLNLEEAMKAFKETFSEKCKAVIINAPQTDYSDEEIKVLEKYLKNGGKLFVAIDPLIEGLERFYAFLSEYGFDIKSGIVIEKENTHYILDTPYYLLPDMQDSDITNSLINDRHQVATMTSKGFKIEEKNGYKVTELLSTSTDAFSKVENFDNLSAKSENDIMGPFSIAAYSENKNEGAVCLLTSNLFFNEEVDSNSMGANRRFFLSVLNKLSGSELRVQIKGKNVSNETALYPNTKQTLIKVVTIGVIPLVILIIGIMVLVLRNRNLNLILFIKDKVKKNEANQ